MQALNVGATAVLVPRGQTCTVCPAEAVCYGGDAEPFARSGYFKQDRTTYLECRPTVACVGGNDTNLQCAKGYSGVACSKCASVRVEHRPGTAVAGWLCLSSAVSNY